LATCRCKCSTTGLSGAFSLDISSANFLEFDFPRLCAAAPLPLVFAMTSSVHFNPASFAISVRGGNRRRRSLVCNRTPSRLFLLIEAEEQAPRLFERRRLIQDGA
jgi:hypothetical protein